MRNPKRRRPVFRRPDSTSRWLFVEELESRCVLSTTHIVAPNIQEHLAALILSQTAPSTVASTPEIASGPSTQAGDPLDIIQFDRQGRPVVSVWTRGEISPVVDLLTTLGSKVFAGSDQYHLIEAAIDVADLATVAAWSSVLALTPVFTPFTYTGAVQTQGDALLNADDLRNSGLFPPTGYDGTGVKVGVISDSVNRSGGGLASSRSTGDLPADVQVLWDGIFGSGVDTDEGRAMLEIIHDIAPGAALAFSTAFSGDETSFGGELSFARAIRELAEAGSDIIVDDVAYFAEPFFQDGIVAGAVNDVAQNWGVSYFSAAGNQGNKSYQSAYVSAGGVGPTAGMHDFDPGAGVDVFQTLTFPAVASGYSRYFTIVLQWDQPFYTTDGVTSDFDLLLYGDDGTTVIASAQTNNIATQQPVEVFRWRQNSSSDTTPQLAIRLNQGSADAQLKYVVFASDVTIDEYANSSGTVVGHAAAHGAIAVAAVPFHDPTTAEAFSSLGPTVIYFDAAGNRLATPEIRNKPDVTAIDGVNTTFFGTDSPLDADTFPNFFGTSAAAPHAAAVAALLKQVNPHLSPSQMRDVLTSSAFDLGETGWDRVFGYGRIDAVAAQAAAVIATDTVAPTATLIRPHDEIRASISSLQVAFSEDVVAAQAADAGRYELRSDGADGVFDTSDDVVYSLVAAYDAVGHFVTLTPSVPQLPGDNYRLTVRPGIADLSGNSQVFDQTFRFDVPKMSREFMLRGLGDTPAVGLAEDGRAFVAWDYDSYIWGQYVGADGYPQASDIFMGDYTWDHLPKVDMLPDGRFVTAFDAYYGGGDWDAAMSIFDAQGRLIRKVGEFSGSVERFTDGAISATGYSVLAWSYLGGSSSGPGDIRGSLYDAGGNTVLDNVLFNQTIAGDQRYPVVGMDDAGRFVVVWQSKDQDGSGWGVYGRRFAADGTPLGDEFRVNSATAGDQTAPAVKVLADGRFIVAWQGTDAAGKDHVYARLFDAAGNPVGAEFAVSDVTAFEQSKPDVAADAAGNFFITWQSSGLVDAGGDVYGKRFAADGTPIGGEFRLNDVVTAGEQRDARVAVNPSGRVFAVWGSYVDYWTDGVRGRILDMSLPDLPDLAVQSVTAPSLYVSGQPLSVGAAVRNLGGTPSANFTARYYLSTDALITSADEALTDPFVISGLAAGETFVDSRSISVRAGLAGSLYVGLVVDFDGQIIEIDETTLNQRAAAVATVFSLLPPPDLVVQSVDAPSTANSSLPISISWTVANVGQSVTNVSSWTDRVYLSTDSVFDASDVLLGTVAHAGLLGAGQSYQASLTATVPHGYSGNYYVLVQTDATDKVEELTLEGNNVGFDAQPTNVALTPSPDLVVSTVQSPPTATAGGTMSVSWTVANQGAGGTIAATWLDRVYLSADAVLDVNTDLSVGSFRRTGELAAGASYSETQNVTLPESIVGSYYVFVFVDSADDVYEGAAGGNNAAQAAVPVDVATFPPNLHVTVVEAPATATIGQTATFAWRVTNDGSGPTLAGFWDDYVYLSTDETLSPATDILLGTWRRDGNLVAGDFYDASLQAAVPLGISGPYFVFVHTDFTNRVFEGGAAGDADNVEHDPVPTVLQIVAAGFPLSESFESADLASLADYWSFRTTNARSSVDVTTVHGPHGGTRHLVMAHNGESGSSSQEAILALDLSGQAGGTDLELDFWLQRIGTTSSDGVTVSVSGNGASWTSLGVVTLAAGSGYQRAAFDLDAGLATAGIALDGDVYVRIFRSSYYSGSAVTIDDLRISNLDVFGPRVTAQTPSAPVSGSLNDFQVTFNEAIDAATFTAADVTLRNPTGTNVAVSGVTTSDNRTFTVSFASQAMPGVYSFTIGPNILDAAGNAMNQDADPVAGETTEDRYAGTFSLASQAVATYPFVEGFESGNLANLSSAWSFATTAGGRIFVSTANQPQSGNFHLEMDTQTSGSSIQTATLALDLAGRAGVTLDFWLKESGSTSGSGTVRMSGDGVTWYVVGSISGTTAYERYAYDIDAAAAAAGIVFDDEFFLRFEHSVFSSGSTFAWDSIQVRVDDADLFGPKVIAQGPSSAVGGPLNSFQVTFNEAIASASFTAADVTIADPTGNAVAVTNITTSDNLTFTVHFAAQSTPGVYVFTVGPGITDTAGNTMNQDGDAVSGETTADRYSGTVTITALPVAAYPFNEGFEAGGLASLGPYWSFATTGTGRIQVVNTGIPHGGTYQLLMDATTSVSSTQTATLALNLLGRTGVTLDFWLKELNGTSGSGSVSMSGNGTTWYTLASLSGSATFEHFVVDLDAAITAQGIGYDDEFYLRFSHSGSSAVTAFAWDDIRVRTDSADLFGPKVVSHAPTTPVSGSIGSFTVTLGDYRNQNVINAATFTAADVVITNPTGGNVAVTSVTTTDNLTFTVQFAAQTLPGTYAFTIGPDISDAAGNALNQDGDAVAGEATDTYQGTFQLAAETRPFPLQEGFESGSLAALPGWSFTASGGTVDVVATDAPLTGGFHLKFDATASGAQSATVVLDLSTQVGATNLELDFWTKRLGSTGILNVGFSGDGTTWSETQVVYDVTGTYRHVSFDLDQRLASAGIALDSEVYLRFRNISSTSSYDVTIDDVRVSNLDVFGPRVVSLSPAGSLSGPVSSFDVTFDEAIDPATFATADVTMIGPTGAAVIATSVSTTDNLTFTVGFAPQSIAGKYVVNVGPQILDAAGNPMNQNGDIVSGVPNGTDTFVGNFTITAVPQAFPISQGFESGNIGSLAGWGFSATAGTIDVVTANSPHGGGYHLKFDATGSGSQAAVLVLDLSSKIGATDLELDFWLQRLGSSGFLYVSFGGDGVNWSGEVQIPLDATNAYRQASFDLDQRLAAAGIAVDADVYVRFRNASSSSSYDVTLDDVRVGSLDVFGPRVISQSLTGTVTGPVSGFNVTFSEAIDGASFTTADVVIKGPAGNIVALSGNPVDSGDGRTFALHFAAPQQLAGNYTVAIGPQVLDLAGNPMNQNDDPVVGAPSVDAYAGNFQIAAVARPFPATEGFEGGDIGGLVGWSFSTTNGTIAVTNSDGPRSGNYHLKFDADGSGSQAAVLLVDLSGQVGASNLSLDLWARRTNSSGQFYLGVSGDGTTWSDQFISLSALPTYGHLGFDLDQRLSAAGIALDADVYIRILNDANSASWDMAIDDVRISNADVFGPRIVGHTPAAVATGNSSFNSLSVTFNEAIDPASFQAADVVLKDPGGTAITIDSIAAVAGGGNTQFILTFADRTARGDYRLTVGPQITDVAGNLMNQNQDFIDGAATVDAYSAVISFAGTTLPLGSAYREGFEDPAAPSAHWQLTSAGSGTVQITSESPRSGANDLKFDPVESSSTQSAVLGVDLSTHASSNDLYLEFWVKGPGSSGSSQFFVEVSGDGSTWVQLLSVDPPTTYTFHRFDLDQFLAANSIAPDADVFVRFRHFGGGSLDVYLDDVALLDKAPIVSSASPAGAAAAPLETFTFVFDEPMDTTSFSLADVVGFTGPGGNLLSQLGGFTWLDNTTLRVEFAPQSAGGSYAMTLAPQILDVNGRPLDQDGDGTAGEVADDRVSVGAVLPFTIYGANMDVDPGWTFSTGSGSFRWQYGAPGGLGGDPVAGHTGTNVVGYNLSGQYPNNMTQQFATTMAIDTRGYEDVRLRFWRWLGIEASIYDDAEVQVSTDNATWTTLWVHSGNSFTDSAWTVQDFDASAVADDRATVYFRWMMGATDGSGTFAGWNIDDVTVVGTPIVAPTVAAVYARGSTWGASYLSHLVDLGAGDAADPTLGYRLSVGTNQLRTLAWTNVDTVSIRFSEGVTINQGDLVVVGSSNGPAVPAFSGFAWNAATFTGTWTFASALQTGKYLLHLGNTVVDGGGAALDGEWTTGASTVSGDGTAGGDFNFRFNVLTGDLDFSNSVTFGEIGQQRLNLGLTTAAGGFNYRQDSDGAGSITFGDVGQARLRLGSAIGTFNEPVAPGSGPQSVAEQAPLPILDGQSEFTSAFAPLTDDELRPIVVEALARWRAAGLLPLGVDLPSLRFEIRDLGPGYVGMAAPDRRILLDDDGAGWGWFVDVTPAIDEEYATSVGAQFASLAGSAAEGRIDLLTVVMHEIGHVLGYSAPGAAGTAADTLMTEQLAVGVRRTPGEAATFVAVAEPPDTVGTFAAFGSWAEHASASSTAIVRHVETLSPVFASTTSAVLPLAGIERTTNRTLERALAAWVPPAERIATADFDAAFAASVASRRMQPTVATNAASTSPSVRPGIDEVRPVGAPESPTVQRGDSHDAFATDGTVEETEPVNWMNRLARLVAKSGKRRPT